MSIRPWVRVISEIKWQKYGKWIEWYLFLNPNTGDNVEFIMFGQPDWVEVIAVTEQGKVILVKQFKQGCYYVNTEVPAGVIKEPDGNDPVKAAARILFEETGYEAGELVSLGSGEEVMGNLAPTTRRWFWLTTRNSPTKFHVVVAKGCKCTGSPKYNPAEPMQVTFMGLNTFLEFMQKRSANAAQTAAVFAALPHLGVTLNVPK